MSLRHPTSHCRLEHWYLACPVSPWANSLLVEGGLARGGWRPHQLIASGVSLSAREGGRCCQPPGRAQNEYWEILCSSPLGSSYLLTLAHFREISYFKISRLPSIPIFLNCKNKSDIQKSNSDLVEKYSMNYANRLVVFH